MSTLELKAKTYLFGVKINEMAPMFSLCPWERALIARGAALAGPTGCVGRVKAQCHRQQRRLHYCWRVASIIIPGGNRLDFPDPIFFNHAINDCVLGLFAKRDIHVYRPGLKHTESIATFSAQSSPIYCDFIKNQPRKIQRRHNGDRLLT